MSANELRPLLQLVPTTRIRFHESPERSRTLRLTERIRTDAQLKNPPIVGSMGNGDFLLLDGANRVSAFLELGYPLVPVQLVDYGDPVVQLKGWHHLLQQAAALNLKRVYAGLDGVELRPIARGDIARALEFRKVFAVLVETHESCYGLFPAGGESKVGPHERIAVLNQVVNAYEGQSRLERVKLADYSLLPEVVAHAEHHLCLFPVFHKEEMLRLASDGVMIPTGLTRHIIPGRALGINLDLAFLRQGGSEQELQAHFDSRVEEMAMQGRIRFYEESVFIMNE